MKFWLDWGDVPRDKDLLKVIEGGAASLSFKLNTLDVEALPISDYNRRYFGGLIGEIQKSIQLRSHILAWTLFGAKVPLDELVFVDYGAGSGLLSLLAKEVGVGTVIYNDIFDVSCRRSKRILFVLFVCLIIYCRRFLFNLSSHKLLSRNETLWNLMNHEL